MHYTTRRHLSLSLSSPFSLSLSPPFSLFLSLPPSLPLFLSLSLSLSLSSALNAETGVPPQKKLFLDWGAPPKKRFLLPTCAECCPLDVVAPPPAAPAGDCADSRGDRGGACSSEERRRCTCGLWLRGQKHHSGRELSHMLMRLMQDGDKYERYGGREIWRERERYIE